MARRDRAAIHLIKGAPTTMLLQRLMVIAAAALLVFGAGAALAGSGQPSPWQMGFQQSATLVMDDVVWFHDFLLYLIAAVAGFVLVLLLIVIVRFNSRA